MILNTRDFVQAGGLISYGPAYPAVFRRAADFVDKILRGAKPGEIPVEQATKFELVINGLRRQSRPRANIPARRRPIIQCVHSAHSGTTRP